MQKTDATFTFIDQQGDSAARPAGRDKRRRRAAGLGSCHGADGISVLLDTPNLAGEVNIYIDTQLKAFRNSKRKQEIMSEIAAGMTDEDIRAIADWYAQAHLEIKQVE